jgi:SNF2 family DNA or RNA helicase
VSPNSIIFSCWTRTLDLVEIYLGRNQIPFLRIDGEILLSKRQKILDRFAEPDCRERVMLMTTGTGAFG